MNAAAATGNVEGPPLASELGPLEFLLGTWTGKGVGDYPTIERFEYLEEVTFVHVGKPFLGYTQRTRSPAGAPLHSETGYWRPGPEGTLEVVLAHPFGLVEVSEGSARDGRVELRARTLSATSSGAAVEGLERTLWVEDGVLRYTVEMAASGEPLQRHLEAELRRSA